MGMQAPIGTGIFKLLHKPMQVDEDITLKPLLFETSIET